MHVVLVTLSSTNIGTIFGEPEMGRFNLVVSNWLSRASGTEIGAWRNLADRQPLVSPKQHLPSHHEHTVHERTFDGVSWVRESILYVLILEIGGRRLDNGGELTMKYPSYAGIQEVEKFTNSEKQYAHNIYPPSMVRVCVSLALFPEHWHRVDLGWWLRCLNAATTI
jgi:hypothetical protein